MAKDVNHKRDGEDVLIRHGHPCGCERKSE